MSGPVPIPPAIEEPSGKTRDKATGDDMPTAPTRRAPRINETNVFAAADELLLAGERPTIDRVRMRLGRGSPNTINEHLDTWWGKLGRRLRDVPGREFPQLPEAIAQTLQKLWNQALDGAHEALNDTIRAREAALGLREQENERITAQLNDREYTAASRNAALEEALALAREQLLAANHRAEALESALQERAAEALRWRTRAETLEASSGELRAKHDADTTAHRAERTNLQERHAAAEAHWLTEVDRARQSAKEAAKRYEKQLKEQRGEIVHGQAERARLRQELIQTRSELKAAGTLNRQLANRLQKQTARANSASISKPRAKGSVRTRPAE